MGPWVVTQGNETGLVTYQGIPLASMGPWVVTQGNVEQIIHRVTGRYVGFNGALGCNPGKFEPCPKVKR